MSPIRRVLDDLVARRLLPVAVALIAAIVAVPMLLGSKDSVRAPAPAGAPPPGQVVDAADSPASIESFTRPEGAGERPTGRSKDPFRPPGRATPRGPAPSGDVVPVQPPSGGGGAIPAASPDTPKPAGGSTPSSAAAKPGSSTRRYATYRADVRFGSSSANAETQRDVRRYEAFPSVRRPVAVFLGLRDARTAVFLVGPNTRASGEGRCRPTRTTCVRVHLRKGQQKKLDYTRADGTVVRYRLTLTRVERSTTFSKQLAQRDAARISSSGRCLVQSVDIFGGLRLDASGLLSPEPSTNRCK